MFRRTESRRLKSKSPFSFAHGPYRCTKDVKQLAPVHKDGETACIAGRVLQDWNSKKETMKDKKLKLNPHETTHKSIKLNGMKIHRKMNSCTIGKEDQN